MTPMKKLMSQFEEEIEGVEEYSKCALENKDDPELFKMYLDMAGAEMGHAQKLQNVMLRKMVDDVDPQKAVEMLKEIWDCQKEDMVGKVAKAKAFLDSVK